MSEYKILQTTHYHLHITLETKKYKRQEYMIKLILQSINKF